MIYLQTIFKQRFNYESIQNFYRNCQYLRQYFMIHFRHLPIKKIWYGNSFGLLQAEIENKNPLAVNSNPCIDHVQNGFTGVSRLSEQCASHLYDIQILCICHDTACFIFHRSAIPNCTQSSVSCRIS